MKTFNLREYDKQANEKSLVELYKRYDVVSKEIANGNENEYLKHECNYLHRCLTDEANSKLLDEELKQLEENEGNGKEMRVTKTTYVKQLDESTQEKIKNEIVAHSTYEIDKEELKETLEYAMNSRLCDLENAISIEKYID